MNSPAIIGQQLDFVDLDLNPSVAREDEPRLSGQAQRMLQLFLRARDRGEEISTLQLAEVGLQPQARLYECRRFLVRRGLCIDLVARGRDGVNWYAIRPLAKSEFYRRHRDRLEVRSAPW